MTEQAENSASNEAEDKPFMLRKVELWVLFLVLLIALIALVMFAWLVLERGSDKKFGGGMGDFAMAVAGFPQTVGRVFTGETDHHEVERDFGKKGGFHFNEPVSGSNYVLLNRYEGDGRYSVSELYREGQSTPLHTWKFDRIEPFAYKRKNPELQREITSDSASRRMMHALVTPDGGLVLHFEQGAPLYKIDACGKRVWLNDDFAFHHSLEADADGNLWASTNSLKPARKFGYDGTFHEDYLVKLAPDGKMLFAKSVLELLTENGLINRAYSYDRYQYDPFHLNDVQPVDADGPHWRKGDVFLSLGHLNMLLLYRPSTDELLWWTQDKVLHQHDIDIVDENRIMVFDNNRVAGAETNIVIGHNEILFIDFRDRSITSPFRQTFIDHDIRTVSQGLAQLTVDGGLFVEETDQGRLLMLSPDGALRWEFINSTPDGATYSLNWSRYLTPEQIEPALARLKQARC